MNARDIALYLLEFTSIAHGNVSAASASLSPGTTAMQVSPSLYDALELPEQVFDAG